MKSDGPAFKRDTSFSAWLRDDDEARMRTNEKVPTNLSAAPQTLVLRQGRLTHLSDIPAENGAPSLPPGCSYHTLRQK